MNPFMTWKTLSSRLIYKNRWMRLREDKIIHPNGEKGIYSVVETSPGVFTFALTDNNEVYLIKQSRYTTGIESWELPGGGADDTNYKRAAKREFREEAGLTADKWQYVGKTQPLNGTSSQIDYVYIARKLHSVTGRWQKKEGINKVKKFPITKVIQMIKKGEINDGQAIAHITIALFALGYNFTKKK